MAASTPSSRGDFPMNAFALLPPSAVNDREGRSDQAPVSCAPEGPIQVADCDDHADVSAENPLGLLELNLAHTELRETIETLYHAIDALEQERETLQHENARLIDSSERARNDAAKSAEETREKLQARDHEIMQMQHKMRELDRQKERVHSEKGELQLKLDERDATISSLQAVIQQLQDQQDHARSANRSEAEVQRLVEMWSSKERSVAENTVHMRKATMDVQRLAEQLQLQLKQGENALGSLYQHEHGINGNTVELNAAQAELLVVERENSTFRGYLDQHKCARTMDSNAVGQQASSHQSHQELHETRNRIIAMEQANLEVTTENRVLRTKCKEYAKSIRILSSRMDQVQAKGAAAHNLVAKYQESADDGTQTIAELQESLVKLCDQLADERKQYVDRLSEQMHSALDVETDLRREMDILHEKLKKSNQDLNAVRDETSPATAGMCARCADTSNQAVPSSPNREAAVQEPQGLLSPPPLPMEGVRTPQPHRTASKESKNSQVGALIENELEDSHDVSDSTHRLTTAKRDRVTQRSCDITGQAALCRLCNDEPFGFMVRCQKCKDAFHAGCVKKTGTGAKKRLGHIFKCSNCAPHRPTKVARSGGNEVSSNSTTAKGGQTLMQRMVTASLHVIPSRATPAVARPAPPEDE